MAGFDKAWLAVAGARKHFGEFAAVNFPQPGEQAAIHGIDDTPGWRRTVKGSYRQLCENRNSDTARVGKKETVVPVFMLKQQNPNWAWLEEGDTRIPFSAIQRTVEHCESLYGNAQAAAAPAR